MTQRTQRRVTPDELPSINQKLRLVCKACGQRHTYDVGTIYVWTPEDEKDSAPAACGFSKYFRCRDCESAGPWEVTDYLKLVALTFRARTGGGGDGILFATPTLYDGTIIQSPALGEEHLLRLMEREPRSAFLCTRLGNVLRGCGRRSQAAAWYDKALALDAGDIEARYHLISFAVGDPDYPAASEHARSLVRHLLDGCKAGSEDVTRGIAVYVVDILRKAPPEARAELVRVAPGAAVPPEITFIRTLLAADDDQDDIVNEAADRLLAGEIEPAREQLSAVVAVLTNDDGASIELIPALRELVEQEQLDVRKLTVAAPTDGLGRLREKDRHSVILFDGKRAATWDVRSLRELFRGDQAPPPHMDSYPPEYARCFFNFEKHVISACDIEGDRTDQELESIYSALRRRPDGRNHLGPLHDYLWQAAALMLGMHRLSQAEFESVVGALEHSVRKWAHRPVSRNYAGYLRDQIV